MILRGLLLASLGFAGAGAATDQAPASPTSLSASTYTAYSRNTELFAEWRPLIVGEATRLTAHLTRTTGGAFKAYAEGKVRS
jgi:hypothetical protein